MDFCLADSRILYFWQVLKSIHKLIIELDVMQCLFVRRSNKIQRRGRIISNFTNGVSHLLWQPSALWGNLTMCPPSCTLQKRTSSLLHFGQEENISGHSTERRAYEFATGRAGFGWWTLLYQQTLPPHERDSLDDKSMLVHSKKAFLLPSVWSGTEYTQALIWKKSLLICFENYQCMVFPILLHIQSRQRMVNPC